jgi:hypothetical protein
MSGESGKLLKPANGGRRQHIALPAGAEPRPCHLCSLPTAVTKVTFGKTCGAVVSALPWPNHTSSCAFAIVPGDPFQPIAGEPDVEPPTTARGLTGIWQSRVPGHPIPVNNPASKAQSFTETRPVAAIVR